MPPISPDYTERLPALLSARTTSIASQESGVLFDVVIGGIGFVFAIDSQNPYLRESIAVQKDQIDTSTEAGEQTLEGGWVRSQTSWHLGAGADFYEPGNRDEAVPTRFRFKDSRGVDVWTRGRLSLHRRVDLIASSGATVSVAGARVAGDDVWYARVGTGITRYHSAGSSSHGTSATIDGGRLAPAGSTILVGSTTGVFQTTLTGASITGLLTRAAGPLCQPYWAKGRVVTTIGPEIHESALVAGALDATSLLWTHPDSGWTWSGVAETPDAILASGYSGGQSAIYAFLLTDGTTTTAPEITQPKQVAELPPGEEIRSIRSYLGRYLGIGTTAGIRVGVIGDAGQVQYGPLLVETASPVLALAARDSYLYASAGSSVIRVNLAETLDDGLRFPYAYDVELPAGCDVTSLAFDGVTDRVVAGSDGHGAYAASETNYVTSGWLQSGDIRYGTTAPKAFRTIDVNAETPGTTSIAVSSVVSDTTVPLVTLAQGKSGLGVSLSGLPVPQAQVAVLLTLAGNADTPVVEAFAVKAVPVPPRQRLVQYPVQVADRMRDAKGTAFGHAGHANELVEALEALESSQSIQSVSDLTRPEQFEATIEKIEFARVRPRASNGERNFGGVAKVTVRTL